ncbi:FK506-binding protein 5 [Chanos chanos]|uniref:FK506-binding protein 5 n=1 Tax=Chanos chanos TaxID=29144 RepID=A0A6J2VQN7_CHACN|nr:FK506-binding protein 5-like [Chanos chanos]
MTKRKGKNSPKQDDSFLLLEPSVTESRGLSEYVLPCILFLLIVVGVSSAGWFCSQQQQTIDSLSETLSSMQLRITKFQQQLGIDNAQLSGAKGIEERLVALEEAYVQAQRQAEVAIATSEQVKGTDLKGQFWSIHSEMNTKLSELQQIAISTATLHDILKNKSEVIDAVRQSVSTILTTNSELALSIEGLTKTVTTTKSQLDEQIMAVDDLASQLEEQGMELSGLKESFIHHQETLATNTQEVMGIKELLETEQTMRAQALEDQLQSVRRSLDEHHDHAQSLHSQLAAQLEAVHSQLVTKSPQAGTEEEDQDQEVTVTEEIQSPPEEIDASSVETEEMVIETQEVEQELVEETEIGEPMEEEFIEDASENVEENEQEQEFEKITQEPVAEDVEEFEEQDVL